ncbi:hypothetical protein [Methylorubrum extorquens]|uniref:hypothetical protein n=1 Tax=Methylorubrum extorquens TaxID=408 RepID=UPI00223764F7|nr:hypothetical protein [Methylorubrum extorquens]UYW34499.1 hypothetical protein OKB92_10575 [Methylorubrum extorquens]
MFRIDATRKTIFDYVSGMTAHWERVDDWRGAIRDASSPLMQQVELKSWDPKTDIVSSNYVLIYDPPKVRTSMKIGFGDAYDWTSSFEKERPHKFRYSYSLEITEHERGAQYSESNYEYGYCNMASKP